MTAPGTLTIRASTAILVLVVMVAGACTAPGEEGVSAPASGATGTVGAAVHVTTTATAAAIAPMGITENGVATRTVQPSATTTAESVGFAEVPLADLLARPGAKVAYLKGAYQDPGTIMIADAGAGEQAVLASVAEYYAASNNHDVDPDRGIVVFADRPEAEGNSLWIAGLSIPQRKVVDVRGGWTECPRLSPDGTMIAYAAHREDDGLHSQLRLVGTDGRGDRIVADETQVHVEHFRLAPLAWSPDGRSIYLQSTSDSDSTPAGLHVADVATGRIERATTPDEILWGHVLSPDGGRVAYTTHTWGEVGGLPAPAPPASLKIVDLRTGVDRVVLTSTTQFFRDPVWSPDGERLAYLVNFPYYLSWLGVRTVALADPSTVLIAERVPGGPDVSSLALWTPDEHLVLTDSFGKTLFVLDVQTGAFRTVAEAKALQVIGLIGD